MMCDHALVRVYPSHSKVQLSLLGRALCRVHCHLSHSIYSRVFYITIEEAEQADRKRYVDVNIGPKTDPEGNIVRWSIIGKPE